MGPLGRILSERDVQRLITAALDRWKHIDVFVNKAAAFDEPPFLEVDAATVRQSLDTNVAANAIRHLQFGFALAFDRLQLHPGAEHVIDGAATAGMQPRESAIQMD